MSKKSKTAKVAIRIAEENFFHNANIIILHQSELISQIKTCLNKEINVDVIQRKKTSKGKKEFSMGVDADSVNRAIRHNLGEIPNIHYETDIKYGALIPVNKKGSFDFSFYDAKYNFNNLWNYCYGKNAVYNGDEIIRECIGNEQQKAWHEFLETINTKNFLDSCVNKETLTVLGEIQFGNWAMVYKDLFRIMNADLNPGVDLYIYITATSNLGKMLSDGTVEYKSIVKELNNNKSVVKIPTWVIGLDFDNIQSLTIEYKNLKEKAAK